MTLFGRKGMAGRIEPERPWPPPPEAILANCEEGVVAPDDPTKDAELGAGYDPLENLCRLAEQHRVARGLTADEAIRYIVARIRDLPIPEAIADKVRAAGYGAEVERHAGAAGADKEARG